MLQNSDVVIWLRATDEGTVLVYASPGYRNAFAQPVPLSAVDADRWASVADTIAGDSAQPGPTARNAVDTTSSRTVLASGDLEIVMRPRADPPSLTMRLGARSGDPVSSTFFAAALRTLAQDLRDAARVARQMAAAAAAPPPPPPAPTQVAVATPAAPPTGAPPAGAAPAPEAAPDEPVATVPQVTNPPSIAPLWQSSAPPPSAPSARLADGPIPLPSAVALARRSAPPATRPPMSHVLAAAVPPPSVPRMAHTTLRVVLGAPPAPTYRVAAVRTAVSPALPPLPSPPPPPPPPSTATVTTASAAPRADSAVQSGPAAAHPAAAPSDRVSTTTPSLSAALTTVPTSTSSLPAATGRAMVVDSANPDAGRLSDAAFETEVRRREAALQTCYTQYGLPSNPSLSGHITVHVSLSDSGEVMRATVADRSWAQSAGASVEACVVHRVFVWHFPIAVHSSMHDFTVNFGK